QKQHLSNTKELHQLHELVRHRLKIAIVTETWPPEINGVALSLLQLCQGLQKQGHKILLVRPEQKAKCHDFLPEQECLVMSQAIPKYPTLQFGWPQYLKVSKAFEKFVPDVVHIVTEGPLGLTAMQAAKAKNIPVSSG
ncbi:glycosyltransferase, partial [Klebsiella pneumoniae]|uniref:glycosyltransferase n=1 Tax=Klebsiella pneumoniae TaxID=573 RepID=UPI00298EA9F7